MSKDFLAQQLNKPRSSWFFLGLLLAVAAVWAVLHFLPAAKPPVRPVILLINHYPMTAEDKEFYRQANPYGFLLGLPARKNLNPRVLRQELNDILGRTDFVFFIDQEGGSVNRIKQFDSSFAAPAPASFGRLAATDPEKAVREVYAYGLRTGKLLKDLTVDVVFAPLAETTPEKSSPYKSRYFSDNPEIVKILADAYARGLADGGVIPCYKHAIGASAVSSDPHYEEQWVTLSLEEIRQKLLPPFEPGRKWPFLMTAHAYYTELDAKRVSTYSPRFYRFVREEMPFDGFIIPDALNMYASGKEIFLSPAEQMNQALAAGADLVIPLFNLDANPGWMLEQVEHISPRYIRRFHKRLSQKQPFSKQAETL